MPAIMTNFFLLDTVTGNKAEFSFMQLGSEIHIVNKFNETIGKMSVKGNILCITGNRIPLETYAEDTTKLTGGANIGMYDVG